MLVEWSQTINMFDDVCLNAMNITRDAVAEIRTSSSDDPCQNKDDTNSFAVNYEAPMALRYCYVAKSEKKHMVVRVVAPTNSCIGLHAQLTHFHTTKISWGKYTNGYRPQIGYA